VATRGPMVFWAREEHYFFGLRRIGIGRLCGDGEPPSENENCQKNKSRQISLHEVG